MKLISLLAIFLAFLVNGLQAQTTNTHRMSPLPKEFNGMAPTNEIYDVDLAAVYRCKKDGSHIYALTGIVFPSGISTASILLNEHLFTKEPGDSEWAYAVRLARPDSDAFIGYITKFKKLDPREYGGNDMVVATIGSEWTCATNFSSSIQPKASALFFPTNIVEINGHTISNLHSYVTGKPVTILGYSIELTAKEIAQYSNLDSNLVGQAFIDVSFKERPPYIVVEFDSEKGQSGTPFCDNNKRFLILHGGFDKGSPEDANLAELKNYVRRTYHREPQGIAFLTGSLVFE